MRCLWPIFFSALVAFPIASQNLPTASPATPPEHSASGASESDALALLDEVSRKYADAKSYHIEAITEESSSNDLERDWRKSVLSAMVAPGGKYRYEGKTPFASAISVSDGKTVWTYHAWEHTYTQNVATSEQNSKRSMEQQEEGLARARNLQRQLAHLGVHLKSATFLSDETITIGGKAARCFVVRFSQQDYKKPPSLPVEQMLWIDKDRKLLVQSVERGPSYIFAPFSRGKIPFYREAVTTYSLVDLDAQFPDNSFTFDPPLDAKLVQEFPETEAIEKQQHSGHEVKLSEWLGKPAPEITVTSSDGKAVSLSSFVGRPVLIDVWATWCGPCTEMIPDLKKLYAEIAGKNLVFLTVDIDEDPATATEYLAREKVSWPNYHDAAQSVEKPFGARAIPFQLVIDREGKVVFLQEDDDMTALRAALAKLGPEYSSLTPGAQPKSN